MHDTGNSQRCSVSEEALLVFEAWDLNTEQYRKVAGAVQNAIQCDHVISDKRKRATPQTSLDCLFKRVVVLVVQSCLTLCDPMDCSLPVSCVHGILQARIVEWIAISFSRGSSQPRDQTLVSCIAGKLFTI